MGRHAARGVVAPAGAKGWLRVSMYQIPQGCRWKKNTHYLYWSMLRKLAGRPGLDFY